MVMDSQSVLYILSGATNLSGGRTSSWWGDRPSSAASCFIDDLASQKVVCIVSSLKPNPCCQWLFSEIGPWRWEESVWLGNDLAWTHLREEAGGLLFRGDWRLYPLCPHKGPGKRELIPMDSFPIFWHNALFYWRCWGHFTFIKVSSLHQMPVFSFQISQLCHRQRTNDSGRTKVTNVVSSWASLEDLACVCLCVGFSATTATPTEIQDIVIPSWLWFE